jgi:hypothetical protein
MMLQSSDARERKSVCERERERVSERERERARERERERAEERDFDAGLISLTPLTLTPKLYLLTPTQPSTTRCA